MRDDPLCIVKLKILDTELDRPPVQVHLPVLSRRQAEEEGYLDEVSLALGKGAGNVGPLRRGHDKAHWDIFFPLRRRILILEVAEHPREALVEVLGVVISGFFRIMEALQKVGIGDSKIRRCN